jgi:hypothetical protein
VVAVTEDAQEINKEDLEWRLSKVGWQDAKITGAKTRDGDIIDVWVVWSDKHAITIPSGDLLGRAHCMEALIHFYESKTKRNKTALKR